MVATLDPQGCKGHPVRLHFAALALVGWYLDFASVT